MPRLERLISCRQISYLAKMWCCRALSAFLWAWGVKTGWAELPPVLYETESIRTYADYPAHLDPAVDFGGGD